MCKHPYSPCLPTYPFKKSAFLLCLALLPCLGLVNLENALEWSSVENAFTRIESFILDRPIRSQLCVFGFYEETRKNVLYSLE